MDCSELADDAGSMTSPAIAFLIILASFVALDLIAWRWGADTRVGRDWQWGESPSDRDG
jgi:hypothetical protein